MLFTRHLAQRFFFSAAPIQQVKHNSSRGAFFKNRQRNRTSFCSSSFFFFCSNEFIVLNTAVIAFDLLCAIKRSQCCAARPCFLKNPFLSFVSPSAFLFPGIAVHLIQLVLTCAALHRGQPVVALVRTLHLQMAITLKRRIAAAAPTAVCRREQLEACTLISTGCMFFPMTAQQVTAFPMNAQNLESAASQRFF